MISYAFEGDHWQPVNDIDGEPKLHAEKNKIGDFAVIP